MFNTERPESAAPTILLFGAGALLCWYILDNNTIQPGRQALRSTCAALQALSESPFGRLGLARRSDHRISEGLTACIEAGHQVWTPPP